MRATWLLVVVLAAAAGAARALGEAQEHEGGGGDLVVAKQIDTPYFVERRNLTIKYSLHNIGDGPALGVTLRDDSFPAEHFTLVEGQFSATFDEIPRGENKTFTFVLLPLHAGDYMDQSGRGEYRRTADGDKTTFQSSFVGKYTILTETEYQATYADHTLEWVIFVVLALIPTAVPLGLYFTGFGPESKAKTA